MCDAGRSCRRIVRSAAVVWRVVGDRVIVREVRAFDGQVSSSGSSESAELVGVAALVFVAAERPATIAELAEELGMADREVIEACTQLQSAGWLVEAES